MSADERPIEIGDRFVTKDKRDPGRVVEVVEALGTRAGVSHPMRDRWTHFIVQTETHPRNPEALGRRSRVSERTLRHSYERVSR